MGDCEAPRTAVFDAEFSWRFHHSWITGSDCFCDFSKPLPCRGVFSTLVMAAGAFAIGLGAIGKTAALRAGKSAIGHVEPSGQATIAGAATEEARVVLAFGALLGIPALLAGAGCLAVQQLRLPRPELWLGPVRRRLPGV